MRLKIGTIVVLVTLALEGTTSAQEIKKLGELIASGYEIKAITTLQPSEQPTVVVAVQKGNSAYICGVIFPTHAMDIGTSAQCFPATP